MAYSTTTQLQNNVQVAVNTFDAGAELTAKLNEAIVTSDKRVNIDVANVIDTSLIPATGDSPATPDFINLLSQYKAAEICLVRMTGARRVVQEENDIQYWKQCYDELLKQILEGKVPLVLSDGTNTSIAASASQPIPDVP